MLRHLTLILLVACSSKREVPAPTPALSFVPQELSNELAGANIMIAVNVEQTDLSLLLSLLPPNAGCARDLVSSLGVAVILVGADDSQLTAYATKLPERATRACLDQLIPAMGGTTGVGQDASYEVRMGDNRFSLAWKNDIVAARPLEALVVRRGAPSLQMRELIGNVPATAKVFFLGMAIPDRKIKNVIGWAQIADDTIEGQIRAEGTEAGVVQPWLQGVIDGFNGAAEARQIPVDHRWFDGTLADPKGKLEFRIPISVFRVAAGRH